MSRSKRKPFCPITGKLRSRAMKKFKQQANRSLRRKGIQVDIPDGKISLRLVSNVWSGPKDGKSEYVPLTYEDREKYTRK